MYGRHAFHHWFPLLIFGAVVVEISWYVIVQKRSYPWQEMFTNLSVSVVRLPIRAITSVTVLSATFSLYSHRLTTVPLDTIWGFGLLLLTEEFAYYWMHRAGHEVRWLWASHVVRHTPEHIHLASAFRIGANEFLSRTWLFFLSLSLLGFHPLAVRAMVGINLFYQFWLHTDLVGRLGPLERIFHHGLFALRVASRLLPDRVAAEDAVQEAMIRAWSQARHFDPSRAQFRTWLYRIVVNLCIDQRRRIRTGPLPDDFDAADPAMGADEMVAVSQRDAALAAALRELPGRQRAAITLVYDEGMSGAEAARILGLSAKAVERLLARARVSATVCNPTKLKGN